MPTMTSPQANQYLNLENKIQFENLIMRRIAGIAPGVPMISSEGTTKYLTENNALNDYFSTMSAFYERGTTNPDKFIEWSKKMGVRYLAIPFIYGFGGTTNYTRVGVTFIPTVTNTQVGGQLILVDGTTGQIVADSSSVHGATTSGGWKNYSVNDILSVIAANIYADLNKRMPN